MHTPTPGQAPDPAQTAAAQSASNRATAVSQYGLQATNQRTPQGNLSYDQIGAWSDGTPRFQATQSLSPGEQNIYDLNNQTQSNLGQIGVDQSARIGQLLGQPVDLGPGFNPGAPLNLDTSATEARTSELARQRLDPIWQQRDEATKSDLFNSGVRPGTEAYDRAMSAQGRDRNDAYNSMILQGHGQAVGDITNQYNSNYQRASDIYNKGQQQTLTGRNQPINEISALLSGSQVSMPNFVNAPTPGIAPTDYLGAVGQNLAQQNVGFNAANQRYLGLQSGLFSLGSAALGGAGRAGAFGGMGGGG